MLVQSTNKCQLHDVFHEFEYAATPEDFGRALAAWQTGTYIQDAFPDMDANQRQILMTGACQEAWDEMFPPDDDGPIYASDDIPEYEDSLGQAD